MGAKLDHYSCMLKNEAECEEEFDEVGKSYEELEEELFGED